MPTGGANSAELHPRCYVFSVDQTQEWAWLFTFHPLVESQPYQTNFDHKQLKVTILQLKMGVHATDIILLLLLI